MRFFDLEAQQDPTPNHAAAKNVDRGRRTGIVLMHSMYRLRVHGLGRVPSSGPLVAVANHSNYMDGPILFTVLPRRMSFLIKAEALEGPLGWLLRTVGHYALRRGVPDREPLLAALSHLKAGGAIGVFPEGTRGEGNVASVFAGAGWLAARSGATVLPVALRGTRRPKGSGRRFRPRVDVLIGEPYRVPLGAGRAAVTKATEQLRERLASLVMTLDADLATVRWGTG